MALINVSRIVTNARLAQSFVVTRKTGAFVSNSEGEYGVTSATLNMSGIVQPTTQKDRIEFLPEGVRQSAAITIYSRNELRMDNGLGEQSDEVDWQGVRYRVAFSKPWQLHGYYMAVAVGYANG